MRVFTIIGVLFVSASMLGGLVPGMAFHVYLGTAQGAHDWHREQAAKEAAHD